MARLKVLIPIALVALAACGGEAVVAGDGDAAVQPQAAVDPKVAAEMERLKKLQEELAAQKPAFEAARAAGDVIQLEELANTGNVHAQYDRALKRLASEDYMLQQGGFEDMEAASEAGLPAASLRLSMR